jgi:uncharacterized protein YjbJ (UPF0337 family)
VAEVWEYLGCGHKAQPGERLEHRCSLLPEDVPYPPDRFPKSVELSLKMARPQTRECYLPLRTSYFDLITWQPRSRQMNSDQLNGKWKQVKGSVKEHWGKLTDDDIEVIDGKTDQLIGKIQERYGIAREAAEKQVDEWNSMTSGGSATRHKRPGPDEAETEKLNAS